VQRAIVEVRWGPLQGRKAILEPGKSLRVGRTDRADLVVPHDAKLSGVHFELTWDGTTCRLRDLKSAVGTLVGGERVDEARVDNGGWVRAGETDFSIYFEGATPPRVLDADDVGYEPEPAEALARKTQAFEVLRQEADSAGLFAILDAARSDRILELLRESVEEHRSLYEGVKGETMAEVAPYLVRLPKGSRLLEALVREGWGKRWGVYSTCKRPFKEVRRHLRRFLMVENDTTGAPMYFRFYDPGTMRVFLPTCTARQAAEFFGDIGAFLVEGTRGEILRFTTGG
jgi:Domain of unknown function (DUF4123)/Inner membrane component of T3SS, cytoplasmic domain